MQHLTNAARDLLVLADSLPVENELEQVQEIFDRLKEYLDCSNVDKAATWWIKDLDSIGVTGTDLLEVSVDLISEDDSKSIEYTIEPPFSAEEIYVEEYGGRHTEQQSIVIRITGKDDDDRIAYAEIQIEIDSKTGRFDETSFDGWEICHDDEDDDDE